MTAVTNTGLAQVLNNAKLGPLQMRVVVICFAVALLDGFDTQSIAFVAPSLRESWGVSHATFGLLFGAGLFGTMLGALFLGSLADRVGRKAVIAASVLIFGLMSLLSATADSAEVLLVYRFITGLGLGGAIPNIVALSSEYAPARIRTTIVTITFCGFPLGAILGGIASAQLLAAFGWPAVFVLGGTLPLLLLPIIFLWLPESVRYLAIKRQDASKISAILKRIDPSFDASSVSLSDGSDEARPRQTVRGLFAEGRATWTLLLWSVVFLGLLLIYFLVNWIPSILAEAGLSYKEAIMGVVMLNIGGILGSLVIGRISDRYGPFAPLAIGFGVGAFGVAAIGNVGSSVGVVMATSFVTGFFVLGAQLVIPALSAQHYPTQLRSTGVGWSMGMGRVGSAVGPVIGGALLSFGLARGELFVAAAVPAVFAAAAVFAMKFNIPPRSDDGARQDAG